MTSPLSLHDFKFAFRMIAKAPALALVAILCLGVGIGLTTSAFGVIHGAFFSPLPVEGGDQIVTVREFNRAARLDLNTTPPLYQHWRDHSRTLAHVAAWRPANVLLEADRSASAVVRAAYLTPNSFLAVPVRPLLGRTLTPADADPGAPDVIVLSHAVWTTRFSADPAIVGRVIRVAGHSHTVVGVMPEKFAFPFREHAWLPIRNDSPAQDSHNVALHIFARKNPNVSDAQVAAELDVLRAQQISSPVADNQMTVIVLPFTRGFMTPEGEWAIYGFLLAILLFLLVIAANLSNLLLARNSVRIREFAVRAALGATQPRLVGQLLLEAAILGAGGAALGLLICRLCLSYLAARVETLPWWFSLDLNPTILLFAAAAGFLASAVAGISPALKLSRVSVNEVLKETNPSAGRVRFGRLSGALIGLQIAIAVGFISTVGILAQSFFAFGYQRFGLPEKEVLVASIYFGSPADLRSEMSLEKRREVWTRFFEDCRREQNEILRRLSAEPGVRAVTAASLFPGNDVESARIELESQSHPSLIPQPVTRLAQIGPAFFDVLNSRLLEGRDFLPLEFERTPRAVIVNEPFARRHFGNAGALGRRLRLVPENSTEPPGPWLEVVGVAPDLGMNPGDSEKSDGIYIPLAPANFFRIGLRTELDPASLIPLVHQTIAASSSRAHVEAAAPLEQQIADVVKMFRGLGTGLLLIGATSLLLSAVSLYSLASFAVTQRTREFAIRVALGAHKKNILRAALRREALHMLIGAVAGTALAAALTKLIAQLPFDVAPSHPALLVLFVVFLFAVGFAACYFPARRALKIHPAAALRQD